MLYNIKALCNIELHKALSKAFLRVYFLLTSSGFILSLYFLSFITASPDFLRLC